MDEAAWNYRPLLGRIQRLRFELIVSLLPDRSTERLLEVGYGSGVFLPELRKHCNALYGIDPHRENDEIKKILGRFDVAAQLESGSVATMPFEDGFFDSIVAVSTLEFVDDIQAAAEQTSLMASLFGGRGGSVDLLSMTDELIICVVLTGAPKRLHARSMENAEI